MSTENEFEDAGGGFAVPAQLQLRPEGLDLSIELPGVLSLSLRLPGSGAPAEKTAGDVEDLDPAGDLAELVPSFNATGHAIIAFIAERTLRTQSPRASQALADILASDPEGRASVDQAAEWPDVIRNSRPETKPFHFVDIPLIAGGPQNPQLPGEPHVISKIQEFSDALQAGNGSARERADQVSWLFHLFGDIHQPLHCIERTNEFHPNGDLGGNGFKVKGLGRINNLHSLWDASINFGAGSATPRTTANQIAEEHPRSEFTAELAEGDVERWARAGFRLARDNAYQLQENPQNPPKPSDTYLAKMRGVMRRQAALAGYRLADRLEELLG